MAKLFLTGSEDVSIEPLRAALMRRSSKYDVFIFRNEGAPDGIKVRKDAFMAIMIHCRPSGAGVEFRTSYEPGSLTLALFLALLIIPIILFWRLSRSPGRYELEAQVIEAIRDKWPEIAPLD